METEIHDGFLLFLSSAAAAALPIFILLFLLIYLFSYANIFQRWPHKLRPEASSCVISLFHGTPSVLLSTYALITTSHSHNNNPFFDLASPNTPIQELVLDFSTAYFTVDLLHYFYLLFFFLPHRTTHSPSLLFVAHHLATLFVLATTRHAARRGGSSLLLLLVAAEATSACQNVWTLARLRKEAGDRLNGKAVETLVKVISPVFYASYTLARGVVGPILVFRMWVFYLSGGGDGQVAWWLWLSWMLVISAAVFISILWIINLWNVWIQERATREITKED